MSAPRNQVNSASSAAIASAMVSTCFGSRERINYAHFRNVRTRVPSEKYVDVFLEDGEVDILAVMKELVRQHYPRLVYR